ncbi:hypothetical protein MPTK1_7g12560 [Marchantia polymorpha subsp. ruderalis]|uniref:Uncharacterized protein n=2 Tax=Marchantia polymorpha TaxID=3197 RepID=A0AAF6BYU1_MARPO|nr:hypothetical protein MARPO_0003s0264 [Marchantia polymorpha]PTQ49409.1 hypothetical protein MARPO_0003s0264 [Marchantia polymorpha]BBN17174.1 hypothetical protein Mp_7g12560 [Marchantia polymorpha subsp. ruderalis]BBN17175.1 hypothetical protein Mp_7g12560 [Marchantia polymorpha subsp. ruderalis]|eukprot:PTQ49408.1 hypothetical protein MARPO_0003s0264 [Marchantia polymorpha]
MRINLKRYDCNIHRKKNNSRTVREACPKAHQHNEDLHEDHEHTLAIVGLQYNIEDSSSGVESDSML